MPVVFVHGVPETASIWDRLRDRIDTDSVALALPGFGSPRPSDFAATKEAYVDWLVAELGQIDAPIDLVGHDWGGILATRVATTAAAPLRSWVSDAVTVVDPAFAWHDLARTWQTPGEGEAFWDGVRSSPPADTAALLVAFGVPEQDAVAMVEAVDETMSGCILDLYRSADGIGGQWASDDVVGVPGLVLVGAEDAFGDEGASRAVATRLGAEVAVIGGAGHWWPLQSLDPVAAALEQFWSGLGD
ncbi:MAG: alpha/beta hydrolase [Acidimicrobiales bacterium]